MIRSIPTHLQHPHSPLDIGDVVHIGLHMARHSRGCDVVIFGAQSTSLHKEIPGELAEWAMVMRGAKRSPFSSMTNMHGEPVCFAISMANSEQSNKPYGNGKSIYPLNQSVIRCSTVNKEWLP